MHVADVANAVFRDRQIQSAFIKNYTASQFQTFFAQLGLLVILKAKILNHFISFPEEIIFLLCLVCPLIKCIEK